MSLTLTLVVFELAKAELAILFTARLTLTLVVFEFCWLNERCRICI